MARSNVAISTMSVILGIMVFIYMALSIQNSSNEVKQMKQQLDKMRLSENSRNLDLNLKPENLKPENHQKNHQKNHPKIIKFSEIPENYEENQQLQIPKNSISKRSEIPSPGIQIIEGSFIEDRSDFADFGNFENFESQPENIEIVKYSQNTSNYRKLKAIMFPKWLVWGTSKIGQTMAFWKPVDKDSRSGDNGSVETVENLAIASAIVGAGVVAVGWVLVNRKNVEASV